MVTLGKEVAVVGQDALNRNLVRDLVAKYFSIEADSLEYFTNELMTPAVDPFFAELVGDAPDLRRSWELPDKYLEQFDKGWAHFRNTFPTYTYDRMVSYSDFRRNKITVNKNEVKLKKDICAFYLNQIKVEGMSYDIAVHLTDFSNPHDDSEIKKEIEGKVNKIMERIGTVKLPTKNGMKLVLSLNFADWFLCSSGESWTSCLNLDSNYCSAYWAGLPGLIGDKNRAMLYLTDGKQKCVEGIVVDKILSRSWAMLDHAVDRLFTIRWYPNQIFDNKVLEDITGIQFTSSNEEEYVSRHPIKPVYHTTGQGSFIYLDHMSIDDRNLHIIGRHGGHYYHDRETGCIEGGDIFDFTRGLSHLIDNGEAIDRYVHGVCYCTSCNSRMPEDRVMWGPDDDAYCRTCYDEAFVECDHCGSTREEEDTTYLENLEMVVCNRCLEREYAVCDHDKEFHARDEVIETVDGRHIHSDNLADAGYTRCDDCLEYHLSKNVVEIEGKTVCLIDAEAYGYHICAHSGEVAHESLMEYVVTDGKWYSIASIKEIIDQKQMRFEFGVAVA